MRLRIPCWVLPRYGDCKRRAAASLFAPIIEERTGVKVRRLAKGIAARIGTAVHAGTVYMLDGKARTGTPATLRDSTAWAMARLDEDVAGAETAYDETTGDLNTAQQQTTRMMRKVDREVVPLIGIPLALEKKFEGLSAAGSEIVGKPDIIDQRAAVNDLKTGRLGGLNAPQFGGYALLIEANSGRPVTGLREPHVKRATMRDPQPAVEWTTYDMGVAKRAALAVIGEIERDFGRFLESGDPAEWLANPNSMLCSPKYCSAWGTAFCREHRGATNTEQPYERTV